MCFCITTLSGPHQQRSLLRGRKGGCLVTGVYEYGKERRRRKKKKGTEIVYDVQQKRILQVFGIMESNAAI